MGVVWCIYGSVNKAIIGPDNGLSPDRRQAIIWTTAGLLLIGSLGANIREILIKIRTFSFKKIRLKMYGKWRPFCLGLNVLSMPNDVTPRHVNNIFTIVKCRVQLKNTAMNMLYMVHCCGTVNCCLHLRQIFVYFKKKSKFKHSQFDIVAYPCRNYTTLVTLPLSCSMQYHGI